MSSATRDIGGVQFEQLRRDGMGRTLLGGRQLMDHPDADPAAQAAADVELLLSEASGLQRIVEVARGVDGDHAGSVRSSESLVDGHDEAGHHGDGEDAQPHLRSDGRGSEHGVHGG
jgi:hypothetical protein